MFTSGQRVAWPYLALQPSAAVATQRGEAAGCTCDVHPVTAVLNGGRCKHAWEGSPARFDLFPSSGGAVDDDPARDEQCR